MLPRSQRLRKTKDIEAIYQAGRKVYHPLIRLIYLPSTRAISRATVIVSRRVSNRAVERNKVKRKLRASLRRQLPALSAHYDLIILAQPRAKQAHYQELNEIVQKLFKRLV